MQARSTNGYTTFLSEFTKTIYVVCPSCRHQGIVTTSGFSERDYRVICQQCGYNKSVQPSKFIIGGAGDPYFGLPLWLTTSSGANQVWAYNYEHLAFMKSHSEAKHRERNGPEIWNSSLGSRLPKWMLSRRNRIDILQAINRLEHMDYKTRIKNR